MKMKSRTKQTGNQSGQIEGRTRTFEIIEGLSTSNLLKDTLADIHKRKLL